MKRSRRKFTPKFKATVAIEALKERETLAESEENLELMRRMDELFLSDPTLGVLGMQEELAEQGPFYNVKRIRRLLRKMGIEPIYPKKNLGRAGKPSYIQPYLLSRLKITRPNQVWLSTLATCR